MPIIQQLQEFLRLNPWCSYLTIIVLGGALLMAAKAAVRQELTKAIILIAAVALFCFVVNALTLHAIALWVDEDGKKDGDNAIIYWITLCALESGLVSIYRTRRHAQTAIDEDEDEE